MQAAQSPAGSIERFLLVAAFAVSGYSSTAGRTVKPFNPLLGETYELVHAEKGFRAIVEKVRAALMMRWFSVITAQEWGTSQRIEAPISSSPTVRCRGPAR